MNVLSMFTISNILQDLERQENLIRDSEQQNHDPTTDSDDDVKDGKKPRASFTKQQISYLEARFATQKYLTSRERGVLAGYLRMSDAQVKTWFQNRRTKWRRQEAEASEQRQREAIRMLAYDSEQNHSHLHRPF